METVGKWYHLVVVALTQQATKNWDLCALWAEYLNLKLNIFNKIKNQLVNNIHS